MPTDSRSHARAAVLAVAMNIIPAAPIDLFRFLNVPAIVMTLRSFGWVCRERHAHSAQRRTKRRSAISSSS